MSDPRLIEGAVVLRRTRATGDRVLVVGTVAIPRDLVPDGDSLALLTVDPGSGLLRLTVEEIPQETFRGRNADNIVTSGIVPKVLRCLGEWSAFISRVTS